MQAVPQNGLQLGQLSLEPSSTSELLQVDVALTLPTEPLQKVRELILWSPAPLLPP